MLAQKRCGDFVRALLLQADLLATPTFGGPIRTHFAVPLGFNGRPVANYPPADYALNMYRTALAQGNVIRGTTHQGDPDTIGVKNSRTFAFQWNAAVRVERVTTTNNGAYSRCVYGPNYVQSFATVNTVADEAYSIQVFDGAGRVTGSAGNHPGSTGGFSAQNMIYDLMGRTVKQSNPTEISGAWAPSGDDATGWLYTQQSYNWQGRPLITTNTDGTSKELSYSGCGCGCAGGEVVTLMDEGTIVNGVTKKRQRKIYSDILGRNIKTEVFNWDGAGPFGAGGSVYSTRTNLFNARDQITSFYEQPGTSGDQQTTVLTYDGYGRLASQQAPAQTAAAVYTYNADDTVAQTTDGRGVTTSFIYNNRRLATNVDYRTIFRS